MSVARNQFDLDLQWIETTYGARWMNTPSPQKYQIWRMACIHCHFDLQPSTFRMWDEDRKDHPQPYGNFASIAHARKVMRDHIKEKHAAPASDMRGEGRGVKD